MHHKTLLILLSILLVCVSSKKCKRKFDCTGGDKELNFKIKCIDHDLVCDGLFDCPNGRDEENCKTLRSFGDSVADHGVVPIFGLELGEPEPLNPNIRLHSSNDRTNNRNDPSNNFEQIIATRTRVTDSNSPTIDDYFYDEIPTTRRGSHPNPPTHDDYYYYDEIPMMTTRRRISHSDSPNNDDTVTNPIITDENSRTYKNNDTSLSFDNINYEDLNLTTEDYINTESDGLIINISGIESDGKLDSSHPEDSVDIRNTGRKSGVKLPRTANQDTTFNESPDSNEDIAAGNNANREKINWNYLIIIFIAISCNY